MIGLAAQALLRIAQLYAVEAPIRGRPPDERVSVRQARSRTLMDNLHAWLQDALAQVSAKSALAKAIGYAITRWAALTRYLDDGRIEMDNNAAERAIAEWLRRPPFQNSVAMFLIASDVVFTWAAGRF